MTARHPTVGGAGRRAQDKPPVALRTARQIVCPNCQRIHTMTYPLDTHWVAAPCNCCKVVIYWYRNGTSKIETLDDAE